MENELFEKAPVHQAYFKLALPVVFGMVVTLVYNMVDTYFIAQTGDTNLVAGVSLGAPMFSLMIALGDIFGLGGSSVISRLLGQRREEEARRLSVFCFYASIICGVIVTILLLALQNPVLRMLGADADTWEFAAQYYKVIVLGAPFIILSMVPSGLLRTEGLAVSAMVGSIVGAVINIILDPVFISGLGLGAAGAAIATVISNIVADVIYVAAMIRKSRALSVNIAFFQPSVRDLKDVLAIGIPASVTNLVQSICMALTNRFLLPYGNMHVAAFGIAMKVNMIAILILVGFAFGAQPLIGYNYGSGNRERLKKILRFCYGFECFTAAAVAVGLALAAPFLVKTFMDDAQIITYGTHMIRLLQAGSVFMAVALVSTCTFQSAGKAMGALALSISRQGILFAVVIAVMSKLAGYYGILAAQAVSDLLTAVMAVCLFRHYFRKI